MIEAELGYWEVVDDPNAPEPKVNNATEEAEIELANSEEYISPQVLLKKQAEKKNVNWSKYESNTHEQYERIRRKSKSPIWSMLSVFLGGLASIPIATLLIWHVLGKDPLQMGPVVGRYAPWIVPTRFRPFELDIDADSRQPAPPAGASGFRRFDNVMNSTPLTSTEAITESRSDSALPGVSESTGDETTEARSAATDKPLNDVFTIINEVERNLEAWNEKGEDRELHKKLALQAYSNLTSLALAIDRLPAGSPLQRLVRTELNSVGRQIEQHTDIQQLIRKGSRFWLTGHQGDSVGLAIVISIASSFEVDKVWQITPDAAVGEEAMQITVSSEIIPALSPGQSVFVLGSLARIKPNTNLQSSESSPKSASILTANYVYVLEP
jgi:hypothetical protein